MSVSIHPNFPGRVGYEEVLLRTGLLIYTKIKRPRETVAAAVSHPNAVNAMAKDIDSKTDITQLAICLSSHRNMQKKAKNILKGFEPNAGVEPATL